MVCSRPIYDLDDAVHVIGHDNPFVQSNIFRVGLLWNVVPGIESDFVQAGIVE
jgi:hypothetical protein